MEDQQRIKDGDTVTLCVTSNGNTVITGARIIDGSGNPWCYGDVVLNGDAITQISPPGCASQSRDAEIVDATGMVVCPGFIDIQSHSIVPFLSDRRSLSKITQGVTTEIMGEAWTPSPFGGRIGDPFREAWPLIPGDHNAWRDRVRSWTRFGDWLRWLETRGVSVNVGSFIGGGTVREWGKGLAIGDANASERAAMTAMLGRGDGRRRVRHRHRADLSTRVLRRN